MTTSLLVLADTHVPRRARDLPEQVWDAIDRVDLVAHAGDWVSLELVERIRARAELQGVYGNNDGSEVRAVLPEVARWRVEGMRFAMVHETGAAHRREARMDVAFDDVDVLVFGHSHIPWDSVTPAGMRLLNPGSPTDRRRQPRASYLEIVVENDRLDDVRFVYL
ncbi:YfcE family phosphodiesterase [Humibacter sp.]|jgi:putative phosphoesterase|uniref:metallophosphoesterase family protein n=1 Tax=Humibacter sp. TaxID=1940291 RepID=UPI002BFB65CA|nr:YfcE family phosphodiesterase [Humibacter sp.]HVX08958.1 YfcE family phosphodiesterase [Humibacter sp.]